MTFSCAALDVFHCSLRSGFITRSSKLACQDIKLANWKNFFEDTYSKCRLHLDDDGHKFFVLLASQTVQKLVKAVGGGTKPGPDHTKHLLGFVNQMHERLETITPDGSGNEDAESQEYKVVEALRAVIDIKAPPGKVLEAKDMFEKDSDLSEHWLVKAMSLDRGRKILEMAVANAKNREMQCEVLTSLSESLSKLEKAGLLSEEILQDDKAKTRFSAEYGKLVAEADKALA